MNVSHFLDYYENKILVNKDIPSIVLNFKYSWTSYILPLNKGLSFPYIKNLIMYFENDLTLNTIVKTGIDKYFIEIPYEFYESMSNEAFLQFKKILNNGSFRPYMNIDSIVKKQIIKLITSLGGINKDIFLLYSEFYIQ